MNEPPSLLRNDVTSGGHWLKVLLVGSKTNHSAIGSRVTVSYGKFRQAQEVMAQSSFYSVNDRRLHFGLGPETNADLSIRWTNGVIENMRRVAANQLVVIREGAGIIRAQKSDTRVTQIDERGARQRERRRCVEFRIQLNRYNASSGNLKS